MRDANKGLSDLIKLLVLTNKIDVKICKHLSCNKVARYRGHLKDSNEQQPSALLLSGNMNYRCKDHVDDIVYFAELLIDPLVESLIPWIEEKND